MSFNDYKPSWKAKGLTAPERLVLLYLAECRNEETGLCFPGYTTIMKETGLCRGAVSAAIKGLKKKLPLNVVVDPSNRLSNRYSFPWNEGKCSPNEHPVHLMNTVFTNRTPCSPNERGVHQVDCNKEANQELNHEEKKEYNNNGVVVVVESIPDGEPGDGSEAYAKIMGELTGEVVPVQPPVQPVKPPVQPAVKSPPAPANPPLWETWTGDSGGFSESRIRFCVWHQIVVAKNDYYIKNLSVGYIRRAVHKLDEDTPQGDVIPKPNPRKFPNPACPKCKGTGQLKARFVKVEGQKIEQTVIPECDCLHIPGAG